MVEFPAFFRRAHGVREVRRDESSALRAFFCANLSSSSFVLGWLDRNGVRPRLLTGGSEFLVVDKVRGDGTACLRVADSLVVLVGRCQQDAEALGRWIAEERVLPRTLNGTPENCRAFLAGAGKAMSEAELVVPQFVLMQRGAELSLGAGDPSVQAGSALSPALRLGAAADLDTLWKATVRMYTEETGLGLSPFELESYRLSIRHKIRERRVWLRSDGGAIVFKAGTLVPTDELSWLEGIYVTPALRGEGIATQSMRALLARISDRSRYIGLTVNADNVAALKLYERLGFRTRSDYCAVYLHDAVARGADHAGCTVR